MSVIPYLTDEATGVGSHTQDRQSVWFSLVMVGCSPGRLLYLVKPCLLVKCYAEKQHFQRRNSVSRYFTVPPNRYPDNYLNF